jgi:hypothetical protein
MADASRFPQGIVIQGSLAVARPVGTIVRSTGDGQLYVSTNALVPVYSPLTGADQFPGVLTVAPSGGDFTTLTAAVAAVIAGQLILVFPGTFVEPAGVAIPANVTVLGLGGAERTVFSGPAFAGLTVGASCLVQGVNSSVPAAANAFALGGTGSTLRECQATGVGSTAGYVAVGSDNVIEDCTIFGTFTAGLSVALTAGLASLVVDGLVFDTASVCTTGIHITSPGGNDQPHISNVSMLGTVTNGVHAAGVQSSIYLDNVYIPAATTSAFRMSSSSSRMTLHGCTGFGGVNDLLIDVIPGPSSGSEIIAEAHTYTGVVTNSDGIASAIVANGVQLQPVIAAGQAVETNAFSRVSVVPLTIGAGVEVNALIAPQFGGQRIIVSVTSVGGGTRAITAPAAINAAGNTVMTLNAARETVELVAVTPGALRWQLVSNDGAVLS